MKKAEGETEPFAKFAALEVGVGVLGVLGAFWLPKTSQGRMAALIGVAASVLSAGVVLFLKRWAVARSMQAALVMVGVAFALRLLAALVGLAVVMARKADGTAFVVGFFGVYFVCQWLEISYVLAARERGQGGV